MRTANIVTMSAFGAIVMDIVSMLALGYVYFLLMRHRREIAPADALLEE
jgi:ethanolamine permease